MKSYVHTLLLLLLPVTILQAQTVAPLWTDFVNARSAGTTPVLPDYSYAGYHLSEKPIPDVSGRPFFDVTHYGALPNDNRYDDAGIQAAINAAEANPGGGVVYFPAGRYLISPNQDKTKFIRVSKSNIVLKGAGSGDGGTEIFQDSMRIGTRQFQFEPANAATTKLTTITKNADREAFWVDVASTTGLRVGQDVSIRHKSEAFTRLYFAPLQLDPDWTRLFGASGGMQIHEIHTIAAIDAGAKRIKFVNPLHFDLRLVPDKSFDLYTYVCIEECGIEDIRFSSNWKNYPETFVHHKDGIHDSGWDAISWEYLKNSWIRNCDFRDMNEGIFMRGGYQVTVTNTTFTGKKGHSSVHARTGYGVLIKNCAFNGASHHGPGNGYSAVSTVVTNCSLASGQNIDCHSGQPFATLYDDIQGGVFSNLGGPIDGFPHHGRHMVMWNFRHRSSGDYTYDFWDINKRRNNTMAYPDFVGFQPDKNITFVNAGTDQLRGQMVSPRSLFDAQLALRLDTATRPPLTLLPAEDAYVRSGTFAAIALGLTDADTLCTKQNPSSGSSNDRHTFLRFNLPGIPVAAAKLKLYGALQDNRNRNIAVAVYAVNDTGWTAATLTWNNQPSAVATALTQATVTDSVYRYYEWDVSSYVKAAAAGHRTKVSFVLKNLSGTNPPIFWHSAQTIGGKAPQLELVADTTAPPQQARMSAAQESKTPDDILLSYPNPFPKTAVIRYRVLAQGKVQLFVYHLNGQLVTTLVNTSMQPGTHTAFFEAAHLPAGSYVVRLIQKGKEIKKIIVKQ